MAHREGKEDEFPKKQAKKQRTIEKKTILILQDENKTIFHKQ